MSGAAPKPEARGRYGPIVGGGPDTVRTDERFDLDNLDEEEREVVTADDFIIYGKASIEQWNDPPPGEDHLYIEMDALEDSIDQLLSIDNLSRLHKDVKVGEFLESYELKDDTSVHIDSDETMHFGRGDELRTEVIREGEPLPGNNGLAEEDALWVVANVYGRENPEGSLLSEETRLSSYYGWLDGFSVTIYTREFEPTPEGRRATAVDFMAVTIGTDEQIKNKGSHYGVAEFQAVFGSDDAAAAEAQTTLVDKATMGIMNYLFGEARDGLTNETIQLAQEEELELQSAAEEVVGDEADAAHIAQQAEERLESIRDRLEQESTDRDDLVNEVAEEIGWDREDVHTLFDQMEAATEEVSGPDDPAGDGEEEEEEEEEEEPEEEEDDVNIDLEAATDELDERYVTQESFDERMDDLQGQLEDAVGDLGEAVSENLEEQLAAGVTPDPAGGNVQDATQLKKEADKIVEGMQWGES